MKHHIKNKKRYKNYNKINSCKRKLEIVKARFINSLKDFK